MSRVGPNGIAALALAACLSASSTQVLPARIPAMPEGAVRLRSTASIWLSDATPEERNSSAGRFTAFKLKSIQEMAAIRFDAAPVKGRVVRSARLFLHETAPSQLRYVRVSTIGQDWAAGSSQQPYGAPNGATYLWADANQERAWSFAGSEFADAIMGMGQTITTYAERRQEGDGWISVALTPELVYAMVNGQTDGLAVVDGGTPAFVNNMVHSAEAGSFAPFIDVDVGEPLEETLAVPRVIATPSPEHAHMSTGAIQIEIQPERAAFAWQIRVDGVPVPRWQIPFPPAVRRSGLEQEQIQTGRDGARDSVVVRLDTLAPDRPHTIEVVAVGRGGDLSPAASISARSSPALAAAPTLASIERSIARTTPPSAGDRFSVWPVPGLVKISPEDGSVIASARGSEDVRTSANAVWDGRAIRLFGARGEYVSYQLVIERLQGSESLTDLTISPEELRGAGGVIDRSNIELFKNWYARNADDAWQPSYAIPWDSTRRIELPDRRRGIREQRNQSMYVDVYIPKRARPGPYAGSVIVSAPSGRVTIPVELEVYDFELPDTLGFWPELNAYAVPEDPLDYHRLAHQHRLVFNPWVVTPTLDRTGAAIRVRWDEYDRVAGPLLSGDAFRTNRRAGVPTPAMYLPFIDSWPTPLSPETYAYRGHWPNRGESRDALVAHYLTAPYIGRGLSTRYKDAFLSVQRQFVEHFAEKKWNRTEMQLFFGGKNTHRIDFGSNMWWTTDEPFHWDDWLALQFFANLWSTGRRALGADARVWSSRADISRPMWTGRVLDGVVDHVYWADLTDARSRARTRWLSEQTGLGIRAYGGVNPSTASNVDTVSTLLQVWMNGADAFLPWQTLGDDASLDQNDNVGSSTLLVPGGRFGVAVVGDLRLKALRDGQQVIEYLAILGNRRHLNREQLRSMLEAVTDLRSARSAGAGVDNADAVRFGGLDEWQLAGLRRRLAELVVNSNR